MKGSFLSNKYILKSSLRIFWLGNNRAINDCTGWFQSSYQGVWSPGVNREIGN